MRHGFSNMRSLPHVTALNSEAHAEHRVGGTIPMDFGVIHEVRTLVNSF